MGLPLSQSTVAHNHSGGIHRVAASGSQVRLAASDTVWITSMGSVWTRSHSRNWSIQLPRSLDAVMFDPFTRYPTHVADRRGPHYDLCLFHKLSTDGTALQYNLYSMYSHKLQAQCSALHYAVYLLYSHKFQTSPTASHTGTASHWRCLTNSDAPLGSSTYRTVTVAVVIGTIF